MNLVIKIGLLFCFLFGSLLSFSQDKIKFGYHDGSGKVKSINHNNVQYDIEKDTIILPVIEDSVISLVKDTVFIKDTLVIIDSITNDTSYRIIIKDDLLIGGIHPVRISVLLPFMSDDVESKPQYWSISFLKGILIAVDSLSELGISVIVNVYDTENDEDVVRSILNNKYCDSSDIIFGPLYKDNFNIVKRFYRNDNSKKIINLFSQRKEILKNSNNIYFLNPIKKINTNIISEFVKSKDVVIISFQDEIKNEIKNLKNRLRHDSIIVTEYNFSHRKEVTKKTCASLMKSDSTIFIVQSIDKDFVSLFLSFCGISDRNVTIIGTKKWKYFNINIETLMKLKVHIPVSNYFNKSANHNQNLLNSFEERYHHQMNNYSLLSFKSILHFCSDKKQFKFIKFIEGGGFVNSDVKMCVYKDYQLNPVH
ncbi:hypothetical protein N9Q99_00430 [Flavobacteriales bacterium]|nr:hypothetical protein [Flavobacteriales bacterium]